MYRLHDYLPSGNGYKVRLVLRALHLTFQLIEYDITAGETRSEAFLRRNPNGRIPVLELPSSGTCLAESHAICWYLASVHEAPAGRPALLPGTPLARAQVLQWMCFEQYSLEPNVAVRRYQRHSLGRTPAQLGENGERWLRDGHAALGVLETQLGQQQRWLVGDTPTLADYALYAYTHVAEEGDFDLSRYPAVRAWLQRVADLPDHVPITAGA